MCHLHRTAPCLALLSTLLLSVTAARAADQAPPQPSAPAHKQAEMKEVATPEAKNPAVEAVLETNPSTPAEQLRAAKVLAELDRPDLARQFLRKVLDANLNPQQLAELASQFGDAVFIKLSGRSDLAPEGGQLATAVLGAAKGQLQDPQRIAGLIQQLSSPSADVRYQAMAALREAQGAAVSPLVAVLADPTRSAEYPQVRGTLIRLGADAVPPLVGILRSADPPSKTQALRVLTELGAREAMVWMLAPAVSPQGDPALRAAAEEGLAKLMGRVPLPYEAAQLLLQQARRYFDRQEPLVETLPGQVELWTWNTQAKQLVAVTSSTQDASLQMAIWLAGDARTVAPEDESVKVLYLTAKLDQASYAQGLSKPLEPTPGTPAAEVAASGPEFVEKLLQFALQSQHAPAATAAARILGDTSKSDQLLSRSTEPSPLVRAVRQPDRRLRLAAAQAVLKLAPLQPFPGSSYIPETLTFLAATSGTRRALVASPTSTQAMKIGGFVEALGYQVDVATNGDELLRQALASPDYEFILLDSTLDRPPVHLLLQQLRHDCRTALLPVGVFARADQFKQADHLVRYDPLAISFPRPHEKQSVQWQVEQLLALVSRSTVTPPERQQQAALALDLLTLISSQQQQQIYRLKGAEQAALAALYVPALTVRAATLLGELGTPESQTALVDLASRNLQPLEARQAAARAFGRAVQQYGILLTTQQILRQYDCYNQSASLDAPTQKVLGTILDCLEAPTRTPKPAQKAAQAPVADKGKDG